jgi:hypothetical protein
MEVLVGALVGAMICGAVYLFLIVILIMGIILINDPPDQL